MWSPVYYWPGVAVHAVLLSDGRVLTYGSNTSGQQTGYASYDIWDSTVAPDAGHLALPNGTGTDLFCSSSVLLPAQSALAPAAVFIAGGDNWTGTQTTNTGNPFSNVLDVASGTLTRKADMNRPRWYSSSITLTNGETYVQGGTSGTDLPEVRGLAGSFRLLSGVDTSSLDAWYPRNFVAPDGRVFGFDSNGWMYYVDTAGVGGMSFAGQFSSIYAGRTGSAAMFRPGRILELGGNSNGAVVIDINGPGLPSLTPTQSLSSQRQWVNATVLADGRVLATSGSQVANQLVGVNTTAEIWDPTTGQWLQGPAAVKPRLYHSNALLLPDASVLVSGGGATASVGTGPADNLNAEIYYPPYLFTAAGQRAARPVITSAPNWVEIGAVIQVAAANASSVSRVTLVKTGASTHSFNMDQRFLELPFSSTDGLNLSVQAPARAADATPGYYLLFVFNESGVPSVAKILRIGIAAQPNPATVPALVAPAAQSTNVGVQALLNLSASDPNGDLLSFSAAGLPPGLAIDGSTGAISGTPTTPGDYSVTVTVSDGVNATSAVFLWSVNAVNEVVLNPLPPVQTAQAGGAASFTASTQGGVNVVFRWNFGDGSATSAWSSNPAVTHVYANPGNYSVTLSVSDDSGTVQTRTLLQTMYLPATANSPASSSNIVIQRRTSGNALLWIVNQDSDSVSAFDAVTRVKQAEVAVGTAPRSIAVAPNGFIWVTNKRSDSISVINQATYSVVTTIPLPRASQPFGIVMSPAANEAFVVLEATGQLIKFNSTTYAQLGAVAVGSNPRQVSLTANGLSAYVSRYVTPPLPGESTAIVAPTPSTGAEVVVVNAGALSLVRTITLAHSDKPDLENQGRGIPNYLGAAAISPDGTQAWVPSKQDNVERGSLRDGQALDFQNTVRAVSSRILLATNQEDIAKRVDHDNASVASAAAFDSQGVYLFVALETSREVAVIDAFAGTQVMRFDVGRAPQGIALSPDGKTLFVNNFMDRSVGVYDLQPLLANGRLSVPLLATLGATTTEKLSPTVLVGKQHFYDARDTRLAHDRYMSCAACHNDGGADGRIWDFTGQGEGLRNTIALRGRAGGEGLMHWSGNFDEVQDFEGQIRSLAGGTGLMSDADFNTGTRSQPLGVSKAGVSADLDALAAYVASLSAFEPTPNRDQTGALTAAGVAGRAVFLAKNCASCHGGADFTKSASMGLQNVGTIKPSSGQRLGAPLTGIDIPTLRDVWRTAPYLHDGSAATLSAAVLAHNNVSVSSGDLASLVEYLQQIGAEEVAPPSLSGTVSAATTAVNLTSIGSGDWAHWGDGGVPGLVRKSNGAGQISAYTVLGGAAPKNYANDPRVVSWTDGAPLLNSSNNAKGLYVSGIGNGFSFKVPADSTVRTLTVLVGGSKSAATFTAHLSDGSAADFIDTTSVAAGQYARAYTITYSAAGTATLTVSWTQASAIGNVTLNAAAVTGSPPPNVAPVVMAPASQSGVKGQAASLAISASDANGDVLIYGASGLPAGLSINATTGLISGTPTVAGPNAVTVVVSDGRGGSTNANFNWTIQTPPSPPVVSTPASQTNIQGQALSLAISASDANGDVLTYSANGLPLGLSINPVSGVIAGTPTTPGTSTANVAVSDGTGFTTSASFTWTIQPNLAQGGSMSASVSAASTAASLSAVGTGDWAHWGDGAVPGLVRKATGGAQISAYSLVGGGTVQRYATDPRSLSWTDGAPIGASSFNAGGVYVAGVGRGFSVTVPAGTGSRSVVVYVGGWNSGGSFRAHLSDGTTVDFTDTTAQVPGQYNRTYAVTYNAGSAGKQLVLSWVMSAGTNGNVTLNGIALTP